MNRWFDPKSNAKVLIAIMLAAALVGAILMHSVERVIWH